MLGRQRVTFLDFCFCVILHTLNSAFFRFDFALVILGLSGLCSSICRGGLLCFRFLCSIWVWRGKGKEECKEKTGKARVGKLRRVKRTGTQKRRWVGEKRLKERTLVYGDYVLNCEAGLIQLYLDVLGCWTSTIPHQLLNISPQTVLHRKKAQGNIQKSRQLISFWYNYTKTLCNSKVSTVLKLRAQHQSEAAT